MDAENFAQWCQLSGIYLDNESHRDRYRAYANAISDQGLTVVILSDFLHDNPTAVNVQHWREYCVYEQDSQRDERIEKTAAALDAVGATRAAEKVRERKSPTQIEQVMSNMMEMDFTDPNAIQDALGDLKVGDLVANLQAQARHVLSGSTESETPPTADEDIESRALIEQLLNQFAKAHADILQADIDKHGDPRLAENYSLEQRQAWLENQRQVKWSHERQRGDIEKLQRVIAEIERRLSKGTEPSRLTSQRRKFNDIVRRNESHQPGETLPEMTQMLQQAQQFRQAHDAVFDLRLTHDSTLLQRAEALGHFEVEFSGEFTELDWPEPVGVETTWTKLRLAAMFPKNDDASLARILDIAESLPDRLQASADSIRGFLIESFQHCSTMMEDDEFDEYELDDKGDATEASILEHAGRGTIRLLIYDRDMPEPESMIAFPAEWMPEEYVEFGFDLNSTAAVDPFPSLRPERAEPSEALGSVEGAEALWNVASALPAGQTLMISIEIKSPPVTDIEKAYYNECHYVLQFDVLSNQVTFKDVNTPRQDYLQGVPWPEMLSAPRKQWPDLTPLWPTLKVCEFDWDAIMKKRGYEPTQRDDLITIARIALQQVLGAV